MVRVCVEFVVGASCASRVARCGRVGGASHPGPPSASQSADRFSLLSGDEMPLIPRSQGHHRFDTVGERRECCKSLRSW